VPPPGEDEPEEEDRESQTYEVRADRKARKIPDRECEVCGAAMRPEATMCELCGTHIEDFEDGDTPHKRRKERRRVRHEIEDSRGQRLALIMAQVFFGVLTLVFLMCGALHLSLLLATLVTVALGAWFFYHKTHEPDTDDLRLLRRWRNEAWTAGLQFAVSAVVTLGLWALAVIAMMQG
jgi:hypothetical protein